MSNLIPSTFGFDFSTIYWFIVPAEGSSVASYFLRIAFSALSFFIISPNFATWQDTFSTFLLIVVLIFLARFAYSKVFRVSSNYATAGDMLAIITVLQFPLSESQYCYEDEQAYLQKSGEFAVSVGHVYFLLAFCNLT